MFSLASRGEHTLKLRGGSGLSGKIDECHLEQDAIQAPVLQLACSATQHFALQLIIFWERLSSVAEALETDEPGDQSLARRVFVLGSGLWNELSLIPPCAYLLELQFQISNGVWVRLVDDNRSVQIISGAEVVGLLKSND